MRILIIMGSLIEKYEDSQKLSDPNSEKFSKGDYIIERTGSGLHGSLRILRYYDRYDKFGVIIEEELHNELFEALKQVETAQLDRTIRKFEQSNKAYFWLYIKDRMGEIWLSEEDIEKIEAIAEKLREISSL